MALAATPPAHEFGSADEVKTPQERIPLTLLLCGSCGHLQLAEIVDPERLFRNYVYVSGTSTVFVQHFSRFAQDMVARFGLGPSSFVVDVGSNDGTLLKQFQVLGVSNVLGVDPAVEIVRAAVAAGVPTREGFFTPAVAGAVRAAAVPGLHAAEHRAGAGAACARGRDPRARTEPGRVRRAREADHPDVRVRAGRPQRRLHRRRLAVEAGAFHAGHAHPGAARARAARPPTRLLRLVRLEFRRLECKEDRCLHAGWGPFHRAPAA